MNELVPLNTLAPAKYGDDKQFAAVATSANFLPRIQLYGANSREVKKSKIGMGRYGLVRSNKEVVEDLTGVLSCLALSWRPKAMRIDGDDVTSVYNPASPSFQKIQEESDQADSGCMFGPEFLLWLPEANPTCFATLFCCNKTMRREAPNLKGLLGKAATLRVQLIETKQYSWHGPVIGPCSSPFEIPDIEEIRSQVEKFNNPPEEEKLEEAVPSGQQERTR